MIQHAFLTPGTPDPDIQQKQATIPEHDVWVSASAGSGKTKVLTDRVLRLLLPDPQERWMGATPHKILCITFTKAAAALMALRVQAKLGEWAVMNDDNLNASLNDLLGAPPSPEMISSARRLFSKILDTQGGLSIMTIHAFCQSTLGRFAIEAGVTPGFKVLEESRAHDILRQIIDNLIIECEQGQRNNLELSFNRIATYLDLDKLREILLSLMSKSREISEFLISCKTTESIRPTLLNHMGVDENLTPDKCFDEFINTLPRPELLKIIQILGNGAPTFKKNAQKLIDWLTLTPAEQHKNLDLFADAFLKSDGGLRSVGSKIEAAHPEILTLINLVLSHYYNFKDKIACLIQAEQTSDLLIIIQKCLADYSARKKGLNVLDFNDLILKTRKLLESESLDWVQYKLDEGIDHILVDEAQDTNIHQWEIIRHLSDEFLSGLGNTDRLRSLFVVGDEKQSIFSFHGADPAAFKTMQDFFESRSHNALRDFKKIPLETSFRSTRPILQLADAVFDNPELSSRLGLKKSQKLVHFPFRDKVGGLVELWDVIPIHKTDTKTDHVEWSFPPISTHHKDQENEISTSSPLASRIASTISNWLETGETLVSTGLAIEPRDILVLVRTRTNFVPDLIRQLKMRGVPVSGIDRMKLTDQIAVMDCLALAKFARFPDDDLTLACLLKSPFIRISEEKLMALSLNRSSTLWDAVQNECDDTLVNWLKQSIQKSRTDKPFDFFDDILNGICPFDISKTGWHSFAACLGSDCLDPLEEFLSYCLSQEADGVFSLEELVIVLEAHPVEIKRDTEDGDKDSTNQVRIMTVHASKGLEAPIVFLPDTINIPNKGKIDALQWMTGPVPVPLWAARTSDGSTRYLNLKKESYERMLSEHLRLLYVALTRPRDRLYIMAETKNLEFNDFSWYKLIYDGFQKLPHIRVGDICRYESQQIEPPKNKTISSNLSRDKIELPKWIYHRVTDDNPQKKNIIQPSRLGAVADNRVKSPTDNDNLHRFNRGNITHKLFQILPEIPHENRKNAAEAFLSRSGKDLPEDIRSEIMNETLKILNDPLFADVFGNNSMAEVPISGDMGDGKIINGQIDRLVIGHNKILIVDFKTNRPSPKNLADIPESYKNQLRAYKTALSRIFPQRDIFCALLWTDQPLLMPVDI